MLEIIKDLFNYPRSITGQATRETLKYIAKKVEKLKIIKFRCGSKVYDWKIPDEWNIKDAYIKDEKFCMELTLPISLGTVGGLTKLHPMANWCLELLGNPSAEELMEIVAVAGLAQNFAALRSLITSGIQKGHMKMHLTNILNQLQAS